MPSLRELQRALSAHIVAGDGPPLDAWIRVPAGADSAARIAVYTDGYPARVTEALRETYPALANILGDGSLAGLSDRYRGALRDDASGPEVDLAQVANQFSHVPARAPHDVGVQAVPVGSGCK